MTRWDYAADAASLARAVQPLVAELPDLQPPSTIGVYVLDLHIRAFRLRELVAVQQAIQLAFDAAALAVLHPEGLEDIPYVEHLLDQPDIVLDLMWAGPGSLRLSFTVNPLTSDGRDNIRYIFMIGLGVLALMPGGTLLAFAYGAALETILLVGRLAERHHRPDVELHTIDPDALREALVKIGITPPDKSWRPPTSEPRPEPREIRQDDDHDDSAPSI